jgi:cysteine desulfurase
MPEREIYLDHNATTPVRPEVAAAMSAVVGDEMLTNPSSVHLAGRKAKRAVKAARQTVAEALGAQPTEIVFTGGGSEAINLAIKGIYFCHEAERPHVITTRIEHPAVLRTCEWLETLGATVTYLPVDNYGFVNPADVEAAITDRTILVSVMHANNEVGTIEPIAEIGAITKARGIPFHVDAVQTLGKVPIDVGELGVDLLSVSAHKIYGPKGIGALYVRTGTNLCPVVHGGGQEAGLRGGTENVPGIIGFAEAVRLAVAEMPENDRRYRELRAILTAIPGRLNAVRVNSPDHDCLPHVVNLSFLYADGMPIIMNLSMKGIYASVGSACASHEMNPSHVLMAMGLTEKAAFGSVRFSMGRSTTADDLEYVADQTIAIVEKLRKVTVPESIGKCDENCPCFLD